MFAFKYQIEFNEKKFRFVIPHNYGKLQNNYGRRPVRSDLSTKISQVHYKIGPTLYTKDIQVFNDLIISFSIFVNTKNLRNSFRQNNNHSRCL